MTMTDEDTKTVHTELGTVDLDLARDRNETFEPESCEPDQLQDSGPLEPARDL